MLVRHLNFVRPARSLWKFIIAEQLFSTGPAPCRLIKTVVRTVKYPQHCCRTLTGFQSLLSVYSAKLKRFSSMKDSTSDSAGGEAEYELVPQFNPIVGRTQWKPVRADYDYAQEIALSGYGDMLHDTDRNRKYAQAIRWAIRHIHTTQPDTDVHVLDIGTGTGLLSMMAASQGVKSVTACEAFRPMANCAKTVLKENGLDGQVKVIGKQSTKLSVPKDMPKRANLLVAELVDTELIGEACLSTYKHAAESLLTEDATLVPYGADLYCQVVESPFLWSHHRLCQFDQKTGVGLTLGRFSPILNDEAINSCPGAPSVFDIQASELEAVTSEEPVLLGDRQLRCLLARPVLIKHFNFAPPAEQIQLSDSLCITHSHDGTPLVASRSGTAHAFIVWWRMNMEPTQTVPDISTAPRWANDPDSAWRDHWMQAIYFPTNPLTFRKGQPMSIAFRHDLLSLWFDLLPPGANQDLQAASISPERPVCECGMHYAWPRTRIAQLNTADYQTAMKHLVDRLQAQLKSMTARSVCVVVVSDCSLLPIFISEALGSQFAGHSIQFDHIETSTCSSRFLKPIYSQVQNSHQSPSIRLSDSASSWIQSFHERLTEEENTTPGDRNALLNPSVFVIAEPFAVAATLPWDAMHFWYTFDEMRTAFPHLDIQLCSPSRLRIWAVLVEFEQLWKIRAPVGPDCEGFDLTAFDRLVQPAMQQTHALVEPQPLWEYGGEACCEPQIVFDLDLSMLRSATQIINYAKVQLYASSQQSVRVNGIAFWSDWLIPRVSYETNDLDSHWYSPAGPSCSIQVGQRIRWKPTGVQQGVTLFKSPLVSCNGKPISVSIGVSFHVTCGEFQFDIDGSSH